MNAKTVFVLGCVASLWASASAQTQVAEMRVAPEIRNLSFGITHPFRKKDKPTSSWVKFDYTYQPRHLKTGRCNAYKEAQEATELYLHGLEDAEVMSRSDLDSLYQEVSVHETRGGTTRAAGVYSVLRASEIARKSRVYKITIKYMATDIKEMPDGTTKETTRQLAKVTQEIKLSGDQRSAHIEVRCGNANAVELADDMFSVN